jgi:alkanesulfonate monooxygenase SsuD/methylene tetrahydromethanopterin reductase-like flavin-dependent oxidoreductase (luciferase family)
MLGLNPSKWKQYDKSVGEIRSWMAGEPVEVEGAPDLVVMPWAKDAPTVPISLGVFGPRGCRSAGQLADVATAECAELGATQWFYSMVQEEARKAGRGPIPFEVSIATYVSDDVAKAREMCRWEPEILTNVLWHLMRTYPLDTLPRSMVEGFEWLAEIDDWWGQHDWSKHAQVDDAHRRIISDELVDKWTVCGSADMVVNKLRELERIGVSRFICYFAAMPLDELEHQIRTYGEKVIPEFTATTSGAPPRA